MLKAKFRMNFVVFIWIIFLKKISLIEFFIFCTSNNKNVLFMFIIKWIRFGADSWGGGVCPWVLHECLWVYWFFKETNTSWESSVHYIISRSGNYINSHGIQTCMMISTCKNCKKVSTEKKRWEKLNENTENFAAVNLWYQ